MEIRVARPDEYERIGRITVSTYSEIFGADLAGYEFELEAVTERAADCTVLVAADGGEILGAVTYVPGPETSMSEFTDTEAAGIRMLVVDPPHQGRGVGKALTDRCIAMARAERRQRIILHTTDRQPVAMRMYAGMGFIATPEFDVYVSEPPFSPEEPIRLIAFVLEL